MKTLKVLSLILAILMLCTAFVGCGEDEEYSTPKDRKAFATNAEEFDKNIAKLIDVAKYERRESDDGEITYRIIEPTYSAKFSYKVTFNDDKSITLPTTLEKVKKAGWTTEADPGKTVNNRDAFGYWETFTNSKGNQIFLLPENLIDRLENGTVDLPISECDITQLKIVLNEYDYTDTDSGVDKYTKAEGAPMFKCGKVDNYSTIKDVINAFGAPDYISYSAEDNEIYLSFSKADEKVSDVSVAFVADGNYIKTFTLQNYNGTKN